MSLGLGAMVIGSLLNVSLLARWYGAGLRLSEISHGSVLGLTLIILGFQTMTFTLILHMIIYTRRHGVEP
jgi:hypothetical protein